MLISRGDFGVFFTRPVSAIIFGAIVLVVLGIAELIGATLVFLLHPLGRPLGIVLGCVGIVLGIVTGRSSPANGLVTIGLNGYVIYAMAVSGSSFRRG